MGIFKSIFDAASNLIKSPAPLTAQPYVGEVNSLETTSATSKQSFITIPERSSTTSGTDFGNSIMNIPANQQREDLIFSEIIKGNVPEFMRAPKEITIEENGNSLSYYVLIDVLCVGTNEDFLRTPVNCKTARKIADLFQCTLPTTKMARQIWNNSDVKLTPIPGGPPFDASMGYTSKFMKHNSDIENQRMGRTGLISGHKKDYVFTNTLFKYPNNCAIYGWFQSNGKPIQDLNPASHSSIFLDYSQVPRFISRVMYLNGEVVDFYDILNDSKYCYLISDEGPFDASKMYK